MRLTFRVSWWNFLLIVLLGAVCIASYMLVQFLFVNIFDALGWRWGARIDSPVMDDFDDYMAFLVEICIIGPLLEEVIFRLGAFFCLKFVLDKFVFKRQTVAADVTAVLVSALLFALFHGSFDQLVYQFILGLLYAMVFLKTGNFLYPFILHFINNFFVLTYTYIAGDEVSFAWNFYTVITLIVLATVGTCITIGLIRDLKKESNGKTGT